MHPFSPIVCGSIQRERAEFPSKTWSLQGHRTARRQPCLEILKSDLSMEFNALMRDPTCQGIRGAGHGPELEAEEVQSEFRLRTGRMDHCNGSLSGSDAFKDTRSSFWMGRAWRA